MPEDEDKAWQRLDKFLFFARFCKSRAVAGELIETGAVRINRQPTVKPHAKLRPNDIITLPLPARVVVVKVLALSTRRGPAVTARLLYEELV
ncbi:MAG: RNA-binding S4 domain-containing protein [Acidocella sp.]|nr:RNA-binding S4 domain-containing protein [Acidocella sp.]